jgi:hypothetical protein
MSQRDNHTYSQGVADDPFSNSDASFVLARDDSMSSEDDDDQNDFIFDDMFGLEATDDGTTEGQSLKTTSASCHGANVNGNPQVMMYQDEEEQAPSAEDDIEFTNLEMAALELLMLCDASGARHRFFDDLLTLLRQFHKKRIDITKAKGRASFMATMESKVKCPKPFSKKVEGRVVIYFPFFNSLQDLLRSSASYDIDNLCANKAEQDHFNRFQPTTVANNSEIMSNEWASKTQDQLAADKDFDPDQDYFLALQVYGDKTGTNVNQRYPLEPWMFTLVALRLMARHIRGTVSVDIFIRRCLAATTKHYLMTLNRVCPFWISSAASIHSVSNIEIIVSQLSILSHITLTMLKNKLDQQRHRYLHLTQVLLIHIAIRSGQREIVGEVVPDLWVVSHPKGMGTDVRKFSGILK